tara:strand:+ start:875 stop:1141 length:267 start_codon:yes stop_codon:yes gene_type:complete
MKELKEELKITKHFIERYCERILKDDKILVDSKNIEIISDHILNDIDSKINQRDRNNLLFLKNNSHVKLPFQNNQIIIKDSSLVTILN